MYHFKCPGCKSSLLSDLFVVKNAPTQSIVTIKSYEAAIEIPKKDISLAFCNHCGFIFNRTFDTEIDYYTNGYEDQQGFSPTFRKFITGVTEKFIEKYNIRNKDIIEIGCGKGDFLHLICELGNNRGIGIDPAYVPGRTKPSPNVSFIKSFYSEEFASLPCDVIICRHTLEHIFNTGEFVKTIRDSIKEDKEIIVFIEVPNVVRILKTGAFWDIFYEHCSYFSPGSLAKLFRMNDFQIIGNFLEYENQYLFLVAKPGSENGKEKMGIEDFTTDINVQLKDWQNQLLKMKEEKKKVVIWGGGSKAVGFLTHFNHLKVIQYVVDINPVMLGNFIPGMGWQYVQPAFLSELQPDIVIIMNSVYKNEIEKMLLEMNLTPELICL